MTKIPDSVRRAVRTFLQAFIGVFAISLLGWLQSVTEWASCSVDCEPFPGTGVLGKAAVAAFAAGAVTVIAYVQNLLEDTTSFPALLKAPPSRGENPVPSEAGAVSTLAAGLIVAAIGLLLWLLATGTLSTVGLICLVVGVVVVIIAAARGERL